MLTFSRRVLTIGAAVLAALAALAVPTAPAARATQGTCTHHYVPVTLDLLLPATLHGTLCRPESGQPATVQVLIHGGTYNSYYWDFPYQPEVYSYARAATERGYATFNVDRIGYGQSTRPLAATLTATMQANIIHQIVGKLRAGNIGGTAFPKVMLTGHSLGSGIAIIEAATYHDVNGVLLTGMTHRQSATELINVFTQRVYPAMLDPKFAGLLDPGYLTTRPGQRGEFFHTTMIDASVVALDEQLKDLLSATELADDITLGFVAPTSLGINVPTMLAVGGADRLFCVGLLASNCSTSETLRAGEALFFSPAACLRTYVLPNAGHDLNLALDTQAYQRAVLDWADNYVGTTPTPRGCP